VENKVKISIDKLYKYCKNQNWAGYDPYDALNSAFFSRLPTKWSRIVSTQIFRRFPVNLRRFLKIEKSVNPKAMALFIRALVKLRGLIELDENTKALEKIVNLLIALQYRDGVNTDTFAWGYNFPWQSRAFYCEAFSPNIQSTIMAGHALYELSQYSLLSQEKRREYREICILANRYILNNLALSEDKDTAVVRYILNDDTVILNVQAQAAWSFLRAHLLSGEGRFLEVAEKLIRFVEQKQHSDGSWPYAEVSTGRFIDNFHTGFILEALHESNIILESDVLKETISRGYNFYLDHFFRSNGLVSYFHNSTYPVDSHAIAQSVITISKLGQYENRSGSILNNIINWALDNFQSEEGYFYYQKWPFFVNKIPYMRWTQAWMLFALVTLLDMKEEHQCAG